METTINNQIDRWMLRILRVTPDAAVAVEDEPENAQAARRAVDYSLAFSAFRCILQYAILPFVLPAIGVAAGFATHLTMVINVIAIGAIILSLSRFWRIGYKQRFHYLAFAGPALVLLIVFLVLDIRAVL